MVMPGQCPMFVSGMMCVLFPNYTNMPFSCGTRIVYKQAVYICDVVNFIVVYTCLLVNCVNIHLPLFFDVVYIQYSVYQQNYDNSVATTSLQHCYIIISMPFLYTLSSYHVACVCVPYVELHDILLSLLYECQIMGVVEIFDILLLYQICI